MPPKVVHLERNLSLALGSYNDLAFEVDREFLTCKGVGVEVLELGRGEDNGQHAVLEAAVRRGKKD